MSKYTICLASSQQVKVDAVFALLDSWLKEDVEVRVLTTKAKSGVSEQPFGLDEIERGANNRLKGIDMLPAVSLETGLIRYGPKENDLADITCCVLRTNVGTFTAWSSPFTCSEYKYYIDTWLKLPNRNCITLGSLIASVDPRVDSSKWYERERYLLEALHVAMYQYVKTAMSIPKLAIDVVTYKNVPFIDIQTNLYKEPEKVKEAIEKLTERLLFNTVVVVDARGFLLAAPFMKKGIKIILARKLNKLPKEVVSIEYKKEYDVDNICIEKGLVKPGDRAIILDDVLATGGTAAAIGKLVEKEGGVVVCYAFLFAIAVISENKDSTVKAEVEEYVAAIEGSLDGVEEYVKDTDVVESNSINKGTAVELTSNIKLMCSSQTLPLDKVRFVSTQFAELTDVSAYFRDTPDMKSVEPDNTISVIPPSLSTFDPMCKVLEVIWGKYSTCSDILFDAKALPGKKVVAYVNLLNQREAIEVLDLVKAFPRKDVDIRDITMVVPYMDTATQDRIEYRGHLETLALIDSTASLFDKFKVITYDLHALQSQLIFKDLRNHSIVKLLWDKFVKLNPDVVPVFPDEGSMKRFGTLLDIHKSVTFRKKRDGDKRIMLLSLELNMLLSMI
jgi:adenine phosphoribosyltransferase